jgi:hypothetical protein
MRILYLACHSIAEYEEVGLLTELGHECISQGAYRKPLNPSESRPPLPNAYYDPELAKLMPNEWGAQIHQKLVDWCDCIVIHGIEAWLPPNWDRIKHKHVVFRSIGQAVEGTEKVLGKYRPEGLKIVRYSPLEQSILGFSGGDATIRFYKDPDEYKGWTGEKEQVITVAQAMKTRDICLKYGLFEECTRYYPRKLYGFSNENADADLWGGALTYEELKQVYRENRVFFYTCTFPAPYTMAFMEAWMTGMPVVAIGKSLAGFNIEVPQLIANGVNGFTSDSLAELRRYISALLEDYGLAKKISSEGRKKAIELFDKGKIKGQWKCFFDSL